MSSGAAIRRLLTTEVERVKGDTLGFPVLHRLAAGLADMVEPDRLSESIASERNRAARAELERRWSAFRAF